MTTSYLPIPSHYTTLFGVSPTDGIPELLIALVNKIEAEMLTMTRRLVCDDNQFQDIQRCCQQLKKELNFPSLLIMSLTTATTNLQLIIWPRLLFEG